MLHAWGSRLAITAAWVEPFKRFTANLQW